MQEIIDEKTGDRRLIGLRSRKDWPAGIWDGEPDRIAYKEEGLDCIVRRSLLGAWCGYVAVPKGHPWFGLDYLNLEVSVHGGLTYCGLCEGDEKVGICHADEGEVWWLGFDCAHGGVLTPRMADTFDALCPDFMVYRTLGYVRAEVSSLVRQIRGAA